MDLLPFAYTLPDAIRSLVIVSAVLLFLVFYIILLAVKGRKATAARPVQLPAWLFWITPLCSGWLDRLSLRHIVAAFVQALAIALVSWTALMAVLLIVLAGVYGP